MPNFYLKKLKLISFNKRKITNLINDFYTSALKLVF